MEKKCEWCGKKFNCNDNSKVRFCSSSCRGKYARSKQKIIGRIPKKEGRLEMPCL